MRGLGVGLLDPVILLFRSVFYFRWSRNKKRNEKMSMIKMRNELVELYFQNKSNEELRDVNESIQNEIEVMWRHLKKAFIEAATKVCSSLVIGYGKRRTV